APPRRGALSLRDAAHASGERRGRAHVLRCNAARSPHAHTSRTRLDRPTGGAAARLAPARGRRARRAGGGSGLRAASRPKRRVPPSGDKHDYVSMGPYWWPNPAKRGGLPYVRRDGERNPEMRDDYDAPRLAATTGAVTTLGLAYYFTDDEKYARRAALLLR